MAISEVRAHEIVQEFADAAKEADVADELLAIFIIGSLATRNYLPGQSDIDTVLIACDTLSQRFRDRLRKIRTNLVNKYYIPKGMTFAHMQKSFTPGCVRIANEQS